MWSRLERSWMLIKASGEVVLENKRLLVLPALSALASLIVIATFAVPIVAAYGTDTDVQSVETERLFYAWIFLLYVVLYFVAIFFNTALVSVALARLEGREAGLRDGLSRAVSRLGVILGYAVIAATVGVVLRAIEERVGWVGRIVVGLIGVAWTLATFLVVPILAAENVGPMRAVRDSAELLKRTWGENIAGNVGMAFVFGIFYVLIVLAAVAGVAGAMNFELTGVAIAVAVVAVAAGIVLATAQAALQGVYAAALYRYARDGATSPGFDAGTFASAFRPKN